jgi:hypothetical protein
MALRSKATAGALLIAAALAAHAQTFEVRHRHLHGGAAGTLRVTSEAIIFTETGKHEDHSRTWRFADVHQLTLSDTTLRILTYEDDPKQFGRDRRFLFDQAPQGMAAQLYPLLLNRMDQRFVAALAHSPSDATWRVAAKLLRGTGGSQGEIAVSSDAVVYRTDSPEQSRTWRLSDIDSISSGGPFDLTITTLEDSGRDFRFQLKRAITEREYDSLWRAVQKCKSRE